MSKIQGTSDVKDQWLNPDVEVHNQKELWFRQYDTQIIKEFIFFQKGICFISRFHNIDKANAYLGCMSVCLFYLVNHMVDKDY
jgi:hypothetical protein